MTVHEDMSGREHAAIDAAQRARFGHDPREIRIAHWGELLDDSWAEEFDRRLAAWETESIASDALDATEGSALPV